MLERLTLPAKLIGVDKRHIPRIIAPNLQFFKWQVDYQYGDQIILDKEHEEWLRAVVEFAAGQQQTLKTIFIWVVYHSWQLIGGVCEYPWDLLDAIGRDAEMFGIHVQYDEPDISRKDFGAVRRGEPDDD